MTDLFIILFLCFIPVFFITMFTPYITRKTESFGVSIPAEIFQHPLLIKQRKKYVVSTIILSIITLITLYLLTSLGTQTEKVFNLYFPLILIVFLVLSFFIYLYFHYQMKRLKKTEKWFDDRKQQVAIQTNFFQQKLTYSFYWYLPAFFVSALTFAFTIIYFDRIPNEIPMNYNFFGEATNTVDKTAKSVFLIPIMQLYLISLFILIHLLIRKSKQQISAVNPERSMQESIIFRRRWSLFSIISALLLAVEFGLIQFALIFALPSQYIMYSTLFVTLLIIGAIIFLAITTGQGGSRTKKITQSDGQIIDRDDDQYWKLGVFYFNRNDPAMFLEKRFGVGWTINAASPIAWIILLSIIGLAILIPLLLS